MTRTQVLLLMMGVIVAWSLSRPADAWVAYHGYNRYGAYGRPAWGYGSSGSVSGRYGGSASWGGGSGSVSGAYGGSASWSR